MIAFSAETHKNSYLNPDLTQEKHVQVLEDMTTNVPTTEILKSGDGSAEGVMAALQASLLLLGPGSYTWKAITAVKIRNMY